MFLFAIMILLHILFPLRINTRYSTLITATDGTLLHAFLSPDDKWRMFVELNEISPTLRKAIIYKEDRFFYYHFGVNPVAVVRAFYNNVTSGRRTSGASTITMQVVRLLYPGERTYLNKLVEIGRAMQLEVLYSKDEILQLYLNLVPYGSNIEGIKSASYLFFRKSPDRLSLAEVTALSIIPNRPTSLKLGDKNQLIIQERNKWLRRFGSGRVFTEAAVNDALKEPLRVSRGEAPRMTPHLAWRLKKQFPQDHLISTSIRLPMQEKVEQIVSNYVQRLQAMNIRNAAILVINNQTMEVETYVGSAGFGITADGGQVDGIQAVRSPGSALKPVLYAVSFDKGIITPRNMINDVPTNFNGFEPENFDRKFNGRVTIEFALANSLNIPAVKVLKDLGKNELIEVLKRADFGTIKKQEKELGLSIVLGGCGVTLEEMTQLYASLANGGKWEKIRLKKEIAQRHSSQLISQEASFLTTKILSQIKRPDLPNNFDYTYRLPRIAWKTGTSYGRRDAWSIGYNKKYTVGVWVGNFSGEGVPELSGAEIATPLLFQVFNSIDYNSDSGWFTQPDKVFSRQVCQESGDLPNEYCSNKVLDYAIDNVSHTRKCSHIRRFFINYAETMSYCTQCLPINGNYKEKNYPNHAPELISFYESKHILYERIPPHNPACTRVSGSSINAPVITNPTAGSEYYYNPNDPQQMQLACQAAIDVKEVYWYLNDKLLKKAKANQPVFFQPSAGKLKISCTDDKGRSSSIEVTIKPE